ncbi:tetratricopeptide repeat protein [Helicobacter sp. MIT 99-5507]|uniref:tetratricopeptide repeat protein n=1 Tax=Helicobacter sp. MIT 99-5507 TaxID=152489 RepID=UPI0015F151AE|nr:tetratricopeptide repeat protein [Helicobacter sp. MIT 99-5507]
MKYIICVIFLIGFSFGNSPATNAAISLAQKGNYVEAFSLFNKACNEEGDANGCLGVGLMYMYAVGTNGDHKKAMSYYKKACSGGVALACSNLASIYDNGTENIPQDRFMASELYMVGCNGGDVFACNNLGYMYANGLGVEKDYFKSLQYYKFACDAGSSLGCYNLGLLSNTYNVFGLNKDKLGLLDLNYIACNQGDLIGCANLGYMYATGIHDTPKSPFNAIKYLNIACEGGVLSSCNNLATFYENGSGVRQNLRKAMELYGIACDKGLEVACKNYRILNQKIINENLGMLP